jgi:hypothetical protein
VSSSTERPQLREADTSIISWDRQAVGADSRVYCPLRQQPVRLEQCLECRLLVRRDRSDPPRFVVCYARVMSGWLGLDEV